MAFVFFTVCLARTYYDYIVFWGYARTYYDYLDFYIVFWGYIMFFIATAVGPARALRSEDRP